MSQIKLINEKQIDKISLKVDGFVNLKIFISLKSEISDQTKSKVR